MKRLLPLLTIFPLLFSQACAGQSLDDIAFLEGHWWGDNDGFIFEETWSAPEGGVMTAMARGVNNGKLAVLEYILVTEENNSLVMRFKHFNADYSNWEGEETPITLRLTIHSKDDVLFTADEEGAEVKSIRYVINDTDQLEAQVVLFQNGAEDGFTLTFEKAND